MKKSCVIWILFLLFCFSCYSQENIGWDFVFVENSEGAHNSRLDGSCLDKADALITEALGMFGD